MLKQITQFQKDAQALGLNGSSVEDFKLYVKAQGKVALYLKDLERDMDAFEMWRHRVKVGSNSVVILGAYKQYGSNNFVASVTVEAIPDAGGLYLVAKSFVTEKEAMDWLDSIKPS